MFKTLKNAWKVPELQKKLLFTLLIIFLYRLGANIPVPYVSGDLFSQSAYSGTILDFMNLLSGGSLGRLPSWRWAYSPTSPHPS